MFVLVWSCLKAYGWGRVLRYGMRASSVVDLRSVYLIFSTLAFGQLREGRRGFYQ
jgi:hypothetical protein